ncbi:DMT family transporter [Pseudonocardia eucalypti]|uniref:DMT family transporter n=1 Tax=Pseudonocardia eucalypti TaxID=648755 RepID=UPI0031ED31B7
MAARSASPPSSPPRPGPGWPALGWLLALGVISQVAGWLLIAGALARMSAATGATLMLLEPIAAVGFGVLLLGEQPSGLQLTGCAVAIAAVCFAGRNPGVATERRRGRPSPLAAAEVAEQPAVGLGRGRGVLVPRADA